MLGWVLQQYHKIEKHRKIEFCCVISRIAQNVHILECLFDK